MDNREFVSLSGVTRSHSAEIEGMIAGIEGKPGRTLWTSEMRATVRKDDPPEDEKE